MNHSKRAVQPSFLDRVGAFVGVCAKKIGNLSQRTSLLLALALAGCAEHAVDEHIQGIRSDVRDRLELVAIDKFEAERDTCCIDGRKDNEAIGGEPAGNLGRMIDEAVVMSRPDMANRYPTPAEIREIVRSSKVINIHTDEHGMERLNDTLEKHLELGKLLQNISIEELVENGTNDDALNRALAEVILQTIGCGYLQKITDDALTNQSRRYGIPYPIIRDFFIEAMLAKWHNAHASPEGQLDVRVIFEKLLGEHEEEGILWNTDTPEKLRQLGKFPLLKPSVTRAGRREQKFVVSLGIAEVLAADVDFRRWQKVMKVEIDAEQWLAALKRMRTQHTMTVAEQLAPGKQILKVTVDPNDLSNSEVKPGDHVPKNPIPPAITPHAPSASLHHAQPNEREYRTTP